MRLLLLLLVFLVFPARADDTNDPKVLRKSLDEALAQLKSAQDRKNELATENERLTARLAELERQLSDANREVSENAARTWALRSQVAAWEQFLKRYPSLLNRWKVFLESDPLSQPSTMPTWSE